jgi:DNA (cytosine-5)-methyltransferase 1
MNEVSIFDGHIPYYKITKPVRLIELFAGIGSQHQALKNLGVKIDRTTIVEWQVNSIQAYNDIHIRKYDDWTSGMTKDELAYRLHELGISLDYNEPAKLETLMRKGEDWLRNVYNNIINTNNKVNIMSVKGSHLNITNTDKYDYILTYSFPCQDLSKAGKGKGMSDTNTRSGLLWEVDRILSELTELPQILLMENVPDVIGSRYIQDFKRWDERLRELGYSNHIEVLNAKNYGIPQNRERAFMISILGNYQYRFPQPIPLTLRLKDMLEPKVDEKYYLSDVFLDRLENVKSKDKRLPEMLDKIDFSSDEPQSLDLYNRTVSDISQTLTMPNHNAQAIVVPEDTNSGFALAYEGDGVYINRPEQKRGVVQKQMIQTIKANSNDVGVVVNEVKLMIDGNIQANGRENGNIYNQEGLSPTLLARDYKDPKKVNNNLRIRKLVPIETWRLMGFSDEAFNLAAPNQSNSSLYHQAGDSIVVNVLMALFKELL